MRNTRSQVKDLAEPAVSAAGSSLREKRTLPDGIADDVF
jgi:hypothetical protein